MQTKPYEYPSQVDPHDNSIYEEDHTLPVRTIVARLEEPSYRIGGMLLALSPVVSFLGQYVFSLSAGTQLVLFRHPTVMFADWIFVPFNFFVVRVIQWTRGGKLYVIVCISVILNVITHAVWQYNGVDPGHMITKTGIILPAGWVHLVFSTLEMVLLMAFVFCRKTGASGLGLTTFLATVYFLAQGIGGYIIHRHFIISDVTVFVCGFFFILIYPRLDWPKKYL